MLIWISAAVAQPCDTPLTEEGLRAIVGDARAAIAAGDTEAHGLARAQLSERIPCLIDPLPRRPWADFLVTEALVRNLRQDETWTQTLKLALDLVPEHPEVPDFLLDAYTPPAPVTGNRQNLPNGKVFMLDGRPLLGTVPPLRGLHIVQLGEGDKWESWLLEDGPIPDEWLKDADVPPPPPAPPPDDAFSWGVGSLQLGFGRWSQTTRTDLPATIPLNDRDGEGGVLFGLDTHGQQRLRGAVGLMWSADIHLHTAPSPAGNTRPVVFGSLFGGAALLKPVSIWLGGGFTTVRVEEIAVRDGVSLATERAVVVPHYLVGVAYRGGPIDASLGGGFGPPVSSNPRGWASHLRLQAGYRAFKISTLDARVGLDVHWVTASLGDSRQPIGEREALLNASSIRTGLSVGVGW